MDKPEDRAWFDGACASNPGGAMGAGWRITRANGIVQEGWESWPPAAENTNNRAEYLALAGLLRAYLQAGGQGPLLIQGDSRLVINHLTGAWKCRDQALRPLLAEALTLAGQVPDGVRFEWVPRARNTQADALSRAGN